MCADGGNGIGKRRHRRFRIAVEQTYYFTRKIKYDHVSSFAGHAALFVLMSLVPMLMFCVSIFQYLPVNVGEVSSYVLTVMPRELEPLLQQIIGEVYGSTTVMQSFTVLMTLFCASKGVYAVIIGMNAVYGIRETRSMVVMYALAIIYVVIFFLMLGLTMVLVVLGNNLFGALVRHIPGLLLFERLFRYGKYVITPLLLVVLFMLIYMKLPNRKSRIQYEFPGAVFSTVVWLIYSWGFSFYIDNYANYSVTYGSLATIVIFILWLYGTMNIIFVGAEINVALRKLAEYGYNYMYVAEYYKNVYHVDE
ncbi:MAG: YihY/virulence factor BrkB family protein [Roseburia sp.]|nr:YihY/virulence factor BrkB family protein [Roseburia sp.]